MSVKEKYLSKSILACLIAISAYAVMIKFEKNSTILGLLIICTVYYFYKTIASDNIESRTKCVGGIYAVLLSLAIVAGSQVHYVGMRSKVNENYIELDLSCFLTGITLAVLLYPFIIFLLRFIEKHKLSSNSIDIQQDYKKFFLIAWLVIFSAWLPYLLTFYPGGLVGDGACTLEEALQAGIPNSNHWVVLYILVLKLFLKIGSFISTDINVGIFLYVVFESISFSAVCAAVATKVKQKGVPNIMAWVTVLLYAFSGFFASYSITLWKDALFSAAIVLLVLLLWELPCESKGSLRYCLKFVLLSLFICFWRNNGIYVLILCIVGIAVLLKKQGKHLLMAGVSVVLITSIIQGPVYDSLGIGKDSLIESFSVPIQQIAAVINEGAELTDYQQEILFSTIPKEKWIENYCPTLSDDLKTATNIPYLEEHLSDFLAVWAQLLLPHLGTYVKAYLMQMLGFWQPGVYRGNYFDYWVGVEDFFDRGYEAKDMLQATTGISLKNILESRMEFIPSGTMVWLMFFALSAILCQNTNKRRRILVLLPLLASWLIIMIASPIAYAYRYIVMIPLAFPVIFTIPFFHNEACENLTEEKRQVNTAQYSLYFMIMVGVIGVLAVVFNLKDDIKVIDKYKGGELSIYFTGNRYNATDYAIFGVSGDEGAFSWTSEEKMAVEIPVKGTFDELSVEIVVVGTFIGEKTYVVKQKELKIAEGTINGAGTIEFDILPKGGELSFEIYFPDSQVVSDVIVDSTDDRKIALQLESMIISED